MAKQGMSRPDRTKMQRSNEMTPVPEIQGKAKSAKKKVLPIITDSSGPNLKVYHTKDDSAAE